MTTPHNNDPAQRRRRNETLWSYLVIPLILLLTVGSVWYLLYRGSNNNYGPSPAGVETPTIGTLAPDTHQVPTPGETERTIKEPEDIAAQTTSPGPDQAAALPVDPEQQCQALATNLRDFFSYLDHQDYMAEFTHGESSQKYFINLAHKLLDNPPVVVRESDDLYTMLKNMAHFFRIIGNNNITLVKTVLNRERDKIEDVASWLYQWSTTDSCSDQGFALNAPLNKMYEYAGFFLNTMGGRSYLFRRDSRCRLLVNYYSILIIDEANKRNANPYGLTIQPLLSQLIQEIESSNQLIYKEAYLDKLVELSQ